MDIHSTLNELHEDLRLTVRSVAEYRYSTVQYEEYLVWSYSDDTTLQYCTVLDWTVQYY